MSPLTSTSAHTHHQQEGRFSPSSTASTASQHSPLISSLISHHVTLLTSLDRHLSSRVSRLIMEAPLSPPSINQPNQCFSGCAQSSAPTSAPQIQPQTHPQTQQRPVTDASATSPFLSDFNLVAEAAKRAQMAVLMRDLKAVGL